VLIVGVSFADLFRSKGFSSTHVPQTDAKAPQLEQLGSKSFDLMMFMFLTGVATNHP
jgi:hypothetical protein